MAASHTAGSSLTNPTSDPAPHVETGQDTLEMTVPRDSPSPTPDSADDEDALYGDGDDAQSFIQPAISPVATRLTSPKTPAAERAAAMERLQGEEALDSPKHPADLDPAQRGSEAISELPGKSPAALQDGGGALTVGPRHPQRSQTVQASLPSPWQPGPRNFVVDDAKTRKLALTGVFGTSARQQRASSIGDNALRRLSKAFPSVTLPNFSSSSFFSSSSTHRDDAAALSPSAVTRGGTVVRDASLAGGLAPVEPGSQRLPSDTSNSLLLRRSNSEDSMLYHSLSRVSSFGDDDRFTHIREQVNVRIKAIKDSWDTPTFKLPSIFPDSLKSGLLGASDTSPGPSRSGSSAAISQRAKGDGLYPALDRVLETLTGDIVILGGYRGSILRSSQPPHRQLWVPVKVGLNIRKVNLEVGLDPEDEETMEDHIFASGMLQHIGPVDISKRLFKRLRECENARQGKLRVHDYGYDWRLSPHLLSRRLVEFLQKLPSNQPGVPTEKRGALVIAHSLGGMITRHAVNQRPELFSGVLYAGAPQRCINVLGPLRNGDAVLLNEKVLTAQVNFSLRTTFVFLPEDGFCFVEKHTGEEYPVDFYNVDDWIKYRLSPCVSDPPLPPLSPKNNTTFAPLRSLSNLPLRGRSNSDTKKAHSPPRHHHHHHPAADTVRQAEITKDRTLAPQMASSSSATAQTAEQQQHQDDNNTTTTTTNAPTRTPSATTARNLAYLTRTLEATKRFRAELAHSAAHQAANAYPPISVLYGKEIPTVYAARVSGGRAAIACADAYDDLVFHSGDGVVLAREAMPPPGYEIVRDGRVSSDRGHITLLGDLAAVGRALEAVVRGRRKGIGLGGREE